MLDELSLPELWRNFWEGQSARISNVVDHYQDNQSIIIDHTDLNKFNPSLADDILTRPDTVLAYAEKEILNHIPPDSKVPFINVRVRKIPQGNVKRVRDFRSKHIGNMFGFNDVMVISVSDVRPRLVSGLFECQSCGKVTEVHQDMFSLTEPMWCDNNDGGCGKKRPTCEFQFLPDRSLWMDTQVLEIQDSPENIGSRAQVRRALAILEGDLCDRISPGDRVHVTAVQRIKPRKSGNEKQSTYNTYLFVNHFEHVRADDSGEITVEEQNMIDTIRLNPIPALVGSIAPYIEGHDDIKLALGLQLFSGVDVDGERKNFHVLLVGDPSTAKSRLIQAISEFHPHGVYATGKGSTAAGLTAGIVKGGLDGERSSLEAGVVVLADGGLAAIDEFDKMQKEDYGAMYEALEQQQVSIHKAGFQVTLRSRCSVAAAANPKNGYYRPSEALSSQVTIDAAILSRFGLVFVVRDEIEEEADRRVATRIAQAHWTPKQVKGAYPASVWRKYVQLSKGLTPDFSAPELIQHISDSYVGMRGRYWGRTVQNMQLRKMTPRQVGDIIRIAEAIARLHLDEKGNTSYIDLAMTLMKKSLNESDDEIYAGITHKDMSKVESIMSYVSDLADGEGYVGLQALRDKVKELGMGEDELDKHLERLKSKGDLTEPRYGLYKKVN